ncbi:dead end protein 1 [Clupea harengus]|uniref:Dead end protein 1 n=1 Tax=Clupea harengus TaxID=7950 RepID=A0A6P8GVB8_CLUHA|nr:dead end protein 1 [Clupea harengus]XP_012686717.2 dead end protein 1 [Clupea harengus]XP_031443124.1 dead end protein 1 [Clupea harengus]
MSEHQRSPPERLKALEDWLQTTNTRLAQVNGQRKYGGPPPDWSGPAPGAGCEVFLCQLPREVFEDTLVPLCQSAGPLYEFRLMMNFSGQNRGFAYAKYSTPPAARAAIRILHRSTLPCGASLVVRLSTEKHQLVLEGLPGGLERPALMAVLEELGEGLVGLKLKTAVVGAQQERQTTALATYSSHHTASMVKKVVVQAFKKQFGVALTVSWTSSTALPTSPDRYDKHGTSPPRRSGKSTKPPRLSLPSLPLPPQTPVPPRYNTPLPNRPPVLFPNLSPLPQGLLPPSLPLIQGFPTAVGVGADFGGAAGLQGGGPTEAPQWGGNPVFFLRWLCETMGLGAPHYELMQQYTCADGYQHFQWKVSIPGLAVPAFPVTAHIQADPEVGVSGLMRQAQCAAAMEMLQNVLNPPQV